MQAGMSSSMYPKHQHVEHDSWSTIDSTASENVLPTKVSGSMNPPPPSPPPPPSLVINRSEHQRRRNSDSKNYSNQNEQTRQQRNPSPEYDSTDDAEQQQHHHPPPPSPNCMSGITTSQTAIATPLEFELSTAAAAAAAQPPLSSSASWVERLRWLHGGDASSITENEINSNTMGSSSYYYKMGDGIMKEPTNATAANKDHGSIQNNTIHPVPAYPFRKQASSGFSRVASWFTGRYSGDDNSTLADFDESEWTPPDSSYGAAIPVGGWIPKPIRRMVEGTLIALGIVALVYLVVNTSMRVTNERNRNKHSDGQTNDYVQSGDDYYAYESNSNYVANGKGVYSDDRYYDGGLYLDDDRYVAYDQGEMNDYDDEREGEDEDEDVESEDGEGGDRI